ncbi:mCG147856 [Mus musculus]|nr:mCG147856 [Mus musculus]
MPLRTCQRSGVTGSSRVSCRHPALFCTVWARVHWAQNSFFFSLGKGGGGTRGSVNEKMFSTFLNSALLILKNI